MSNRAERGYALLLALVVLLLLMVALALLAGVLRARYGALDQESRAVQLTALADAGLARALAELHHDVGYRGDEETALGVGTFAVEVEGLGETRTVTVRAYYRGGHRTIRADVRLRSSGPQVVAWQRVRSRPDAHGATRPGGGSGSRQ